MHNRKRVLLVGNCEFELLGLQHFLTSLGCEVILEEMSANGPYNLVVVALSAGPLAGWGRYLRDIRMLHAGIPAPMIVLVPPQLQAFQLLRGTGLVCNGRDSLSRLRTVLNQALDSGFCLSETRPLSLRRQSALISLRLAVRNNASLKTENRKEYYHRARLVEHVGVDNLHVLCVSGLVSEVAGHYLQRK
ncbi:hypothetical protein DNU54_20195 [Salmonella enterica subsp. enterica serovar Ajiobo]|nr:hypothetical protein [Salmonella enterica]EBR0129410.1 hypothetical protein [Salmonella enterica subsp. enterica serovar Ajiobo]EBV2696150.1 hypothetical protein [Salmonella enterica subsp. enterica serovar Poona]EBW5539436.1 hypothetical protein [Salmonella enterica subsp. enterica serovar Pasing]OZU24762.1 hypothetical protein CCO51_19365 [Salmonella enterica subsp. enterica serovar Plymouth]